MEVVNIFLKTFKNRKYMHMELFTCSLRKTEIERWTELELRECDKHLEEWFYEQ
jgi:hypothetical protein